ncbi:MAG: metal ABC transporter substrate-binding protein [Peptoniphilus lacrimalis]
MKKIFVILLALLFTACSKPAANNEAKNEESNGKLNVYASVYPIYDFTKKIGGDKINLSMLTKPGEEPHHYEPSSDDIKNLSKADLFIYNGAGLESFTDKIIESNPDLKTCQASEGVDLIKATHDHDHDHDCCQNNDDADHNHNHEAKENHSSHEEEHHHGMYDPHTWLSIKNAKIEMENIKNKLSEIDPDNASYYQKNFDKYAKMCDDLDKEYSQKISVLPNRVMVVSHQAFGYLCGDYGLSQVPIKNISNEDEPDAQTMAQIIDYIKKNNIKYICVEEMTSTKIADTIKAETGAQIKVLSPVETLTQEQMDKGEDYFSIMENNLKILEEVLS